MSTTLLGLGLAVAFVNKILYSSERKAAAIPLLKLIRPNIAKLHNDFFIRAGRARFGIENFEHLLHVYQQHKRNPEAFAPEQRDQLYDFLKQNRTDLIATYDVLQDQFRELATIGGWSFDPRLVSAALSARLNFATFKALPWDDATATKLSAIEAYFDGEADASKVFTVLTEHIGLNREDWADEDG